MRRRLLLSAVLIAVMTATLFGAPVLVLSQRYLRADHLERVEADAQRIGRQVDKRLAAGEPLRTDRLRAPARPDEEVVIRRNGREVMRFGPHVRGRGAISAEAASRAGVVIRISQSAQLVENEVARLRLLVVGFGAAAVLVAIAVGVAQARRLSRSLVDLADTAERLGSGRSGPQGKRYGVPELDRVAEVLDASAERINLMLEAERQLSRNASHQLRSPLTALSMRLEEILVAEDRDAVREEARVALGQVERLTEVVHRLLAPSQVAGTSQAGAARLDIDAVVEQQVSEWRPTVAAMHREIKVVGQSGLVAHVAATGFSQVLSALLENALHHGLGTITVRRRAADSEASVGPSGSGRSGGSGGSGGSVVVEVGDQGPGIPFELVPRIFEREVSGRSGTGLGLALARELAEASGGRLELTSRQPTVFAVFLPRAPG